MLRRNARLRKEYLYRKSLEGKERTTYEQKRKLRDALAGAPATFQAFGLGLRGTRAYVEAKTKFRTAWTSTFAAATLPVCCSVDSSTCGPAEGKPIPTELRRDEAQLRREVEAEDDNTAVPRRYVPGSPVRTQLVTASGSSAAASGSIWQPELLARC